MTAYQQHNGELPISRRSSFGVVVLVRMAFHELAQTTVGRSSEKLKSYSGDAHAVLDDTRKWLDLLSVGQKWPPKGKRIFIFRL
jgi:hypothetical protein